jgi:peptide/nickel transport system ATP-binding protein
MIVLQVEDLSIGLPAKLGRADLVQGLNLALTAGECLGLVGESGAGKTLTGLALAGLLPDPLRVNGGRILIDGKGVSATPGAWRRLRGRDVLTLFQSPLSALDPASAVRHQITDAVSAVRTMRRKTAFDVADSALAAMGLTVHQGGSRPHQLSGGMRQRVLLAFAWALKPRILIADEPTSGLDPVRQIEILELMRLIARDEGVAIILISHDLRVVAQMAREVVVLESGRMAECATIDRLLAQPRSRAGRRLADAFRTFAGGRCD